MRQASVIDRQDSTTEITEITKLTETQADWAISRLFSLCSVV